MTKSPTVEQTCQAIAQWQHDLTDHKFNPNHPTERIEAQQQLLTALHGTATETINGIVNSIATSPNTTTTVETINQAASTAPRLEHPVSEAELDWPQWSTDKAIHAALTNTGLSRTQASDWRYWHIITLQQIRNRTVAEGTWLLSRADTARKFRQEDLQTPARTACNDKTQVKRIDGGIRDVLRRAGGIWHRKANYRLDAPLARAYWRVTLAEAAAETTADLDAQDIYKLVLHNTGNRKWFELATYSGTRLAAPTAIAALALAQQHNPNSNSNLVEQTRTLLRRTSHIAVQHVNTKTLAAMLIGTPSPSADTSH